jgi:invasion protein IalB
MKTLPTLTAFLILASTAAPTLAWAEPQALGSYDAWSAYVSKEKTDQICYISAKPVKSEGKFTKRGGVFAEVTHRPAEHRTGVFTLLSGYTFKTGAPATLTVNGTNFTLFTRGDAAFAQDADDPKIVAAMRGGSEMTFTGTSSKATEIKDTFSLKGLETAYAAINKACNVPAAALDKAPVKKKK